MREIRPKDEQENTPSALSSVPKAPRSTKSACIPCRKRKSKCDGGTPKCSTCTAVYHTQCSYDVGSDHRRKAALRRDIETLKEQNGALAIIVAAIRSSTESEVSDIVQQIRAEEDLEGLAEVLKRNIIITEPTDTQSREADLSNLIGNPSMDEDSGVVKHFGQTSNLSLVFGGEQPHRPLQTHDTWTTVTRDADFVQRLMNLYFSWSHPFYILFHKGHFLGDMAKRRSKYCSPLLVNALLAVACSFSDDPAARADPSDPTTAGDHFFAEAKSLLQSSDSSTLTTIQALALMGLREASCNRDSSGFQFAGRCIRMAIELGLHLSFGSDNPKLGQEELEVRKITFWGCFTIDTAWSLCIGRISQLPRNAINLEMPTVPATVESQSWQPYDDYGVSNIPNAEQPVHSQILLRQLSMLSEIVNDTVFMFYAPRERFTSRKLLDFYAKYTRWHKNLPEELRLREISTPHVLLLHMYYHTVVLHLFRPFLKVELTNSHVSPREVCTSTASSVASLVSTYRQTYGFRRVTLLITNVILSSNIIDLLNLPDQSSVRNLVLGITSLREITANHAFASRSLRILLALAQQWNVQLPHEVARVAYDIPSQTPMNRFHSAQTYQTMPPSPSSILSHSQEEDQINRKDFATAGPFSQTTEFYWAPFPDHSVPLQGVQQVSPMDISSMVDTQDHDWSQLQLFRDGFKMANLNDPVLGPSTYQQNVHWAQP